MKNEELITYLSRLKSTSPDRKFVERMSILTGTKDVKTQHSSLFSNFFGARPLYAVKLAVFVVLFLVIGGSSLIVASADAKPGDFLYPVKQTVDNIFQDKKEADTSLPDDENSNEETTNSKDQNDQPAQQSNPTPTKSSLPSDNAPENSMEENDAFTTPHPSITPAPESLNSTIENAVDTIKDTTDVVSNPEEESSTDNNEINIELDTPLKVNEVNLGL